MSAVETGSIPTTPAPSDVIPRSDMRVIWLLLVAAFVAILNETTMGIAIPHLNDDLGIPPELGQWLTSAFMLTMAVVIPTTGFILQRFTTRRVFIAAMDQKGGISEVQESRVPIEIPTAQIADATTKNWVYSVQLLMRRGPQKLAVGVRDDVAAASSFAVRTLHVGS